MLSWKQKSGTQDSSFRSSLFSTVSFPFAGGAIFTGCYIRCDSCVQHNVLFPLLSHRSLSSWPWWQQKASGMFSLHQQSIPRSTQVKHHIACCLQWTTNFANLSRFHQHKRTFITILQPYYRPYLGHKPSCTAPSSTRDSSVFYKIYHLNITSVVPGWRHKLFIPSGTSRKACEWTKGRWNIFLSGWWVRSAVCM